MIGAPNTWGQKYWVGIVQWAPESSVSEEIVDIFRYYNYYYYYCHCHCHCHHYCHCHYCCCCCRCHRYYHHCYHYHHHYYHNHYYHQRVFFLAILIINHHPGRSQPITWTTDDPVFTLPQWDNMAVLNILSDNYSHHENLPMVKFKSRHISCHCVALVCPEMLCAQHKRGVNQGSILSLHILYHTTFRSQ